MEVSDEILQAVTSHVFEEMYFCAPLYLGSRALDQPFIEGVIEFEGPVSGTFHLAVTDRLAAHLTAEFLMTQSDDVTARQKEATVRELTNVLCGAAINAWEPFGDFRFSVSGPQPAGESDAVLPHCFTLTSGAAEVGVRVILRPN